MECSTSECKVSSQQRTSPTAKFLNALIRTIEFLTIFGVIQKHGGNIPNFISGPLPARGESLS